MTAKQGSRYQKPEIKQVKLVSKQAVLGTCKDGAGAELICQDAGDLFCVGEDARS
jgi:hypothetical protein